MSRKSHGFTLPTVVIVSVVMMILLVSALQIVAVTRRSLETQYYTQLAREAAEAGGAYMRECLRLGYFVDDPMIEIRQNTNCLGDPLSGADYIISRSDVRTSFSAHYMLDGDVQSTQVTGVTERLSPGGTVRERYEHALYQQVSLEFDAEGTRASKRWWYLSQGARLDFGVSGTDEPIVGSIGTSHIMREGITVITSRSGEVKFYSNGLTVWDKEGNVMSNSSDLVGSNTAVQATAAFPVDHEETKYVVVTNTANHDDNPAFGSLYYSVIDMTANGGLGAVMPTAKNIQLGTGTYSGEALSVAPGTRAGTYFAYTYKPDPSDNRVIGFELKRKAVNDPTYATNPIAPPTELPGYTVMPPDNIQLLSTPFITRGTVNFDSDYTRMLVSMGGGWVSGDELENIERLHLFTIDRTNGNLTKVASWRGGSSGKVSGEAPTGYSADFSPSGDYVYASQIYPGFLYRYDIRSGNATTIKNSEQFIARTSCMSHLKSELGYDPGTSRSDACLNGSSGTDGGGQVLRGPDGRMYIADQNTGHLSVIDNPDAPNGATPALTTENVGWDYAKVVLPAGTIGQFGLPQMVSLYSPRYLFY